MASNNGPIYQQSQQQQQQRTTQYHCKECGVYFDSAQSLDVHLQYHKENLLTKWANQAASQQQSGEEANNNKIKRELITSSVAQAAADSSDNTIVSSNNKNPPDSPSGVGGAGNSGHPATPQSYHSAPSPYQNEPTNFSPNFHQFHIKTEAGAPGASGGGVGPNDGLTPPTMLSSPFHSHYQNLQQYPHPPPPDQTQYFDQLYAQDYLNNKAPTNNYHRYQPYQNPNAQVTSSSNNHSPVGGPYGVVGTTNSQPTPSPSPKQCDKCGFVCETAGQLIEHLQIAHPNTPFPNQFQFPPTNGGGGPKIKKEDGEPQAEILDLDSQKVHVYQTPEEQEQDALKRQQQAELAAMAGGAPGHHNPHSVSAMLSTWPPPSSHHQKMMFHPHPHTTYDETTKMYNGMGGNNPDEHKMFDQQPKLFQPHQITNNDYHHQNVSTTTHHDNLLGGGAGGGGGPGGPGPGGPGYRPYEHIPVQPSPPIISSTQIVSNQQSNLPTPITTKGGANWKSNEARRPKTYNCSACNKWFTSSGHLKRHYNTTLHKNAVKSSGQPDPATLPISAHHHPTRDPNHHSNRQKQQQQQQQQQHDVNSQSPGSATMMGSGGHLGPSSQPPTSGGGGSGDDTNSDDIASGGAYDSRGQHPGLLQQPPSGPYDRHPPNISQNSLSPNLTNLSSGSPPNGEAGPSATINELSRGLQLQQQSSTQTSNTPTIIHNIPPHHQLSHLSTNIMHPQISPTTTTSHPHHQLLPPFMDITSGGHHPIMGTSTHNTPHHSPSIFHHPVGSSHQSITNYPNELSPHVTHPTMVVINSNTHLQQQLPVSTTTISHNSIGEYQQDWPTSGQENNNNNCGPLPSFAQFAMLSGQVQPLNHPLGVQIINSNVGGPSSVTDSSSQTSSSQYHNITTTNDNTMINNDNEESEFILPDLIDDNTKIDSSSEAPETPPNNNNYQHIIYRSSSIDDSSFYQQNQQITVLQPIDQNTYNFGDKFSDKLLILSPNNNNYNQSFIDYTQHQTITIGDKDLSSSSLSPLSPNLSNNREEIENETSSPLITSTGSPLNIKRMETKRGSGGNTGALNGTTGNGVHKCIDCDKIFNKACYLTQHNKTFHSGDKPFKCGRCGKRFSDNTNYNIHLKKHAGDKPHKCEQCPKQFNHKTDLRRHMCLHSGYKPYACDTCGKGFIRKDHMVKHCDTHTRKTTKLQQQQQLQTQQQSQQIQSHQSQQDERKFDTTTAQAQINSNNGGNTGNF